MGEIESITGPHRPARPVRLHNPSFIVTGVLLILLVNFLTHRRAGAG